MTGESQKTPESERDELSHPDTDTPPERLADETNGADLGRRTLLRTGIFAAMALVFGMSSKIANAQDGWREPPTFDKEPVWTEEQMKILSSPDKLMDQAEAQRMQESQEAIFREYLNPSLTIYMKDHPGTKDIFDKVLIAAMRNPFDLSYVSDNGSITIRKKINSAVSGEELPDLIIIVDGSGHVTKVNGIDIPDLAQDEYDRREKETHIPQFTSLFKTQKEKFIKIAKLLDKPKNPDNTKKVNKSALQSLPGYMKKRFEVRNIDLPRRLQQCIEARNTAYELDSGLNSNAAYKKFIEMLDLHASDFNDMSRNYPARKTIWLDLSKSSSGIYIFDTSEQPISHPIAITREGYLVDVVTESTTSSSGKTITKFNVRPKNPAYKDRIINLYNQRFHGNTISGN